MRDTETATLTLQELNWRMHVLEQSLEQIGQGIVVLSQQNAVLFVTDSAKRMLDQQDGLKISEGKLVACQSQDQQRLQQLIGQVLQESDPADRAYKSLYVHRENQLRPYLIYVSKIAPMASDTTELKGGVLVIIKDIQANTVHWIERLKSKYNLTSREADFALLLSEGRTIAEIGIVMEIAEDTARQYLKSCFKKMEVQKQHEMVCLVLDCSRKR